jgi:hypothetical protein
MHRHHSHSTALAALVALTLGLLPAAVASAPPDRGGQVPGLEALDYAFKFASAIDDDPKDRAKAQQAVVLDYPRIGALDVGLVRADRIEGWRRGIAYADLARSLVEEGRDEEARKALAEASVVRAGIEDWHGNRVDAHIAQALAELGDVAGTSELAMRLAREDPRQYLGKAAATTSTSLAAGGDCDAAMAQLAHLDGSIDREESWGRTVGYISIAEQDALAEEKRLAALEKAFTSAEGVPGWQQVEAFRLVAAAFGDLGRVARAHEALRRAEAFVDTVPAVDPSRAPLLANVARSWAEAGEPGHARELLARAEPAVASAMEIESPALFAAIGAAYAVAGDEPSAWRLFDKAFAHAEALVNPRPRALAAVAVCRSIAGERLVLDDRTRSRLDVLLRGFAR